MKLSKVEREALALEVLRPANDAIDAKLDALRSALDLGIAELDAGDGRGSSAREFVDAVRDRHGLSRSL